MGRIVDIKPTACGGVLTQDTESVPRDGASEAGISDHAALRLGRERQRSLNFRDSQSLSCQSSVSLGFLLASAVTRN